MSLYTYVKKNIKFLFVAWFLLTIIVSSIPQLPTPKIEAFDSNIRLDYLIHFLEYFILAVFFVLWRMNNRSQLKFKKILLYVVLGMSFALLDEIYQKLVPGRTFNIIDCVYDSLGFTLGILFIFFVTLVHLKNDSQS